MLPGTDRSGIQMHEVRIAVISHPAGLQCNTQIPQSMGLIAGQTNVDGLSFGVVAGTRNAIGGFTQHGIGGRRAVSGNDMEGCIGADFSSHRVECIQKVHVNGLFFVSAVVSKDMVDFIQGVRAVGAFAIVTDIDGLAGVRIVQRYVPLEIFAGKCRGQSPDR